MATLLQYRRLGKELRKQIESANDQVRDLPCLSRQETRVVNDRQVLIVDWDGPDDPENPRNWSSRKKWEAMSLVILLAGLVSACAPIDSPIIKPAAEEFGVSETVESLSVGMFIIGLGVGALIAGPISEVLGRSLTYLSNVVSLCIWLMASGLAPNIEAQLIFRFLAGFSGACPLVCCGGTISDLFTPLEKTVVFAVYAIVGFVGPMLGPVMSAWIPDSPYLHTWRWSEWVALMFSGVVFALMLIFQPETYHPSLLSWKAKHLRKITGDTRYRALHEIERIPLSQRLKVAMSRPFIMLWHELPLQLGALYLAVLYIILFTFFGGYNSIFQNTYNLSTGMTNTLFIAMGVGVLTAFGTLPYVYKKINKASVEAEAEGKPSFAPEVRLWFSMLGAPAIPISLFWMAWTCFPSISLWSPLLASALFGYGLINVFIGVYMYLIDNYEMFAASALTFNTLARYAVPGAMTAAGVPWYEHMGPHWTLTLLACVSVLLTPIPYAFYKYGPLVRKRSRFAFAYDDFNKRDEDDGTLTPGTPELLEPQDLEKMATREQVQSIEPEDLEKRITREQVQRIEPEDLEKST